MEPIVKKPADAIRYWKIDFKLIEVLIQTEIDGSGDLHPDGLARAVDAGSPCRRHTPEYTHDFKTQTFVCRRDDLDLTDRTVPLDHERGQNSPLNLILRIPQLPAYPFD